MPTHTVCDPDRLFLSISIGTGAFATNPLGLGLGLALKGPYLGRSRAAQPSSAYSDAVLALFDAQ